MSTSINFPIEIKSSGRMNQLGYSSINRVQITKVACFKDLRLFGFDVIVANISPQNIKTPNGVVFTTKINLNFELAQDVTESESMSFARKVESYITLLLAKSDENPQSGFSYAEIDWLQFSSENTDSLILRRTLGIPSVKMSVSGEMTKSLAFRKEEWNVENEYNNLIFSNYYDGIKANHYASKYFHWFLIIEAIEHSELYKREFQERLFDSSELDAIAEQFNDNETKRNAITSLKSRTLMSRKEKLYTIFQKLGITAYHLHGEDHILSRETVTKIIEFRNSLFHQGEKLDEWFIWNDLFPIVRDIADLLIKNPNLLD